MPVAPRLSLTVAELTVVYPKADAGQTCSNPFAAAAAAALARSSRPRFPCPARSQRPFCSKAASSSGILAWRRSCRAGSGRSDCRGGVAADDGGQPAGGVVRAQGAAASNSSRLTEEVAAAGAAALTGQSDGQQRPERAGEQILVVIGGGAAGIFAALRAKEECPSLRVVVLERGQPLSKVKISGGGRCNVTTGIHVDPLMLAQQYPRGHRELRGNFFRVFGPKETATWFSDRGVPLKTESDGRMFPTTDSSDSVIRLFYEEARRLGVTIRPGTPVASVTQSPGGGYDVTIGKSGSHQFMHADFVLLATGSAPQGYSIVHQLGHDVVDPRPSLFTFQVADPELHQLAGVSFAEVRATLEVKEVGPKAASFTQTGPLLVTHWGLSGPIVLRLSAWAARHLYQSGYTGRLVVDFVPNWAAMEMEKRLNKHKETYQRKKVGTFPPPGVDLTRRFWAYFLRRQGVDPASPWAAVSKKDLLGLAIAFKHFLFVVQGKGEFKDEFVTAGGVPLAQIHLQSMESRKCPNLFFAGEIIDVDGVTGGYNFQNAWSGGYIAGSTIGARALLGDRRVDRI